MHPGEFFKKPIPPCPGCRSQYNKSLRSLIARSFVRSREPLRAQLIQGFEPRPCSACPRPNPRFKTNPNSIPLFWTINTAGCRSWLPASPNGRGLHGAVALQPFAPGDVPAKPTSLSIPASGPLRSGSTEPGSPEVGGRDQSSPSLPAAPAFTKLDPGGDRLH